MFDYIIVGAGISGCSVAFELSKNNDNILLLDKLPDVAAGASGAAGAVGAAEAREHSIIIPLIIVSTMSLCEKKQ